MGSRTITITAGTKGLTLDVPDGINLLLPAQQIDPAAPLSATAQQELVRTALDPLRELARGRRRAAVVVGDLAQPAPYDLVLPELVKTLVAAEIRPSRIAFLVHPGTGAPLLGRGAIHRYGEEIVGEHDLQPWNWEFGAPADDHPIFAAADLRIAVRPRLARTPELPQAHPFDYVLELGLGCKLSVDISSAQGNVTKAPGGTPGLHVPADSNIGNALSYDVYLAGGGGGEWESTLEEALLSLHEPVQAKTVVLGFEGAEGLGSARFANDLWNLIAEADEVLGRAETLPRPQSAPLYFDPANTVADALSRYENVVLLSPTFAQHEEGEDLAERLREAPLTGARLKLIGNPAALWPVLQEKRGAEYSLYAEPLGWRARTSPLPLRERAELA